MNSKPHFKDSPIICFFIVATAVNILQSTTLKNGKHGIKISCGVCFLQFSEMSPRLIFLGGGGGSFLFWEEKE